jgi:hypothetical protein
VIQRRHVFYVEGYDPQGASGYYGIFQYAAKRCRKVWSIALDVGPLNLDTELLAHWDIQASGPNWRASTRYEFLRLEGVLNANMSQHPQSVAAIRNPSDLFPGHVDRMAYDLRRKRSAGRFPGRPAA